MTHPTSESDLAAIPLETLVARMDEFLSRAHRERYGEPSHMFPIALPSEVTKSLTVRSRSDAEIRHIAHICFSYLVQLEMDAVASGFANALLYTSAYSDSDWQSPVFRLRDGAIRQYQIVGSRIAFEVFIDLLHAVDTGRRLDSKKSKLKAFRTWLRQPNNKFHYFAHVLLAAYRFDRQVRTPEVHGTSRLPRQMLLLQVPSNEESNRHVQLLNVLSGCWRPLLDLLNNVRPNYMSISQEDEEWFHTYMTGDDDTIDAKLDEMMDVAT